MPKSIEENILYALLGRRVAAARKRVRPKPLSQSELAERVGLARGSIANIERGRQRPPLETLYKLAQALEVEPQLLLPRLAELDKPVGELSKSDRTSIKKMKLVGGVAERWLLQAKASVTATDEEGT